MEAKSNDTFRGWLILWCHIQLCLFYGIRQVKCTWSIRVKLTLHRLIVQSLLVPVHPLIQHWITSFVLICCSTRANISRLFGFMRRWLIFPKNLWLEILSRNRADLSIHRHWNVRETIRTFVSSAVISAIVWFPKSDKLFQKVSLRVLDQVSFFPKFEPRGQRQQLSRNKIDKHWSVRYGIIYWLRPSDVSVNSATLFSGKWHGAVWHQAIKFNQYCHC